MIIFKPWWISLLKHMCINLCDFKKFLQIHKYIHNMTKIYIDQESSMNWLLSNASNSDELGVSPTIYNFYRWIVALIRPVRLRYFKTPVLAPSVPLYFDTMVAKFKARTFSMQGFIKIFTMFSIILTIEKFKARLRNLLRKKRNSSKSYWSTVFP